MNEENIFLEKIRRRIKELRKEKGITMQELADHSNVSKGLICQIENGISRPSLHVLLKIINSLDVDLNIFFNELH
jgi:transcriptional regulator with XRE-family HTH domain